MGILAPPEVMMTWPKPNYVDPQRRGPANMIVQFILIAFSTILVVCRLYARLAVTRARIGLDDIAIIIAWIFAVGFTSGIVLGIQSYGWDLHIWDVPFSYAIPGRKLSWACMIIYHVSTTFTRLSILLFYLRILVAKIDKIVTKITIAAIVAYSVGILVILFLQCRQVPSLQHSLSSSSNTTALHRPFSYYWDIMIPTAKGNCIDENRHMAANAILNLVLETVVFLIPLRSLFKLKIRTSQKLQIISLFSVGLLVLVSASVRLYYGFFLFASTYDTTWHGYMSWLWCAVEVNVAIICACVPSCRAFFTSWNRSQNKSSANATGTARSYNHIDEDVRTLTRNAQPGSLVQPRSHATVEAKSLNSDFDDSQTGVMVQMEVFQYQEEYHPKASDGRGGGMV